MKNRNVSVFRKLYILFVILIGIIYAFTILIFLKYAYQSREKEMNEIGMAVSQNVSSLEQQLNIIYDLEQNLVVDDRICSLAYDLSLNDYERAKLILGLIANIQGFQSLNNIIGDITVFFPRQKLQLSAEDNYCREEYIPMERGSNTRARNLVYYDRQVRMELLYPLTYSIEENYIPDFGVCITLAEDYLGSLLAQFNIGEQGGAFLVLDNGREVQGICMDEKKLLLLECWNRLWTEHGRAGRFLGRDKCEGTNWLFVSESLPQHGITMVVYRDEWEVDRFAWIPLLVMGGVLLLISVLFAAMIYQTNITVNKPIKKVMYALGQVQKGNLEIQIFHNTQDEFQYIYSSFNGMVQYIKELMENMKEQGRLLQNAELIQLQSQINPHFLYNSFYLIRIMAKNESYEQITKFVTSLAKYYCFLNRETEQNIPLVREVEHMENYIDIQQMRFGDKIAVDKGLLPETLRDYRVPKLILQPIVENAYHYGMKTILKGGHIRVAYRAENSLLFISIEDNGKGGTEENIKRMRENIRDYRGRAAGHALSNIDRRLKLAYGDASGIMLEKSELGGVKVTLCLDMSAMAQ